MRERLNRWGYRAAVAACLAIGAYYATFGGVYSVFDLRQMKATRTALQDSVFRLETVTDSLAQRGDSLVADPGAIERVAREEHGFLRDGELRVRFIPGSATDESAEVETPEAPDGSIGAERALGR